MKKIFLCANFRANPSKPSCAARGSKALLAQITDAVQQNNLNMMVEASPCMGFCEIGPNMRLVPGGQFFHHVEEKNLSEIIDKAKTFLNE